ncbi:MAG: preprotein translocase subunit SecG [Myxococcota bacterium]|nr:preprotein translocase subunit SecG [Myxococcota bacterium]
MFCLFLIVVILLQSGRGAGIGAAFGGASQTVFGPRGAASLLSRITAFVAVAFMLTSITLAWLSSSSSSQMEKKVAALQDVKSTSVKVNLDEKPTEAAPTGPAAPDPSATVKETDLPAGAGAEAAASNSSDSAPAPQPAPAEAAPKTPSDKPAPVPAKPVE